MADIFANGGLSYFVAENASQHGVSSILLLAAALKIIKREKRKERSTRVRPVDTGGQGGNAPQ